MQPSRAGDFLSPDHVEAIIGEQRYRTLFSFGQSLGGRAPLLRRGALRYVALLDLIFGVQCLAAAGTSICARISANPGWVSSSTS